MIRRIATLCLAAAVTAAVPASARDISGTWTASLSDEKPGRIYFSLTRDHHNQHGSTFPLSVFRGLSSDQIHSSARTPVEFELRSEAGIISFEGTFRDGKGAGEFLFVPDRGFVEELRSMGLRFQPRNGDADQELFQLALFGVSSSFIRSMRDIGYDVSLEKYVEFRIFGVDPEYVREMGEVGFRRLTADKLVETRIHGATPEYIRDARARGDDLTLDKYIESRIFDVTPEFAREMERAGYRGLSRDMLVQFRIHGVTPTFIEELDDLGYSRLSAQKLVEMRIHGVTPEFIRKVEKAGYRRVPVDKLVQMRIFHIDPEMVRALDDESR